ncbi:hypothetical protein Tcan_07637 [Toxocara canis]|uniref:Chromo domain-containing protein n=1 Tax=Toxocara canis TaxID=6265 RepID=A0A0B2VAC8_TOXCA|nr:hypothetical protein Tcan_07637 [Toxocara canis]
MSYAEINDELPPNNCKVERIIGYRYNKTLACDEYLVKWDGFPEEESTWQSVSDLSHARVALKQFLGDVIRRRARDPALPYPDSDSDSELAALPSEDEDTEDDRIKRVFPKCEDCGITKGWKPKRILGAQLERRPYTYFVEYMGKKRKEHIYVGYMYAKYPKLAAWRTNEEDSATVNFEVLIQMVS